MQSLRSARQFALRRMCSPQTHERAASRSFESTSQQPFRTRPTPNSSPSRWDSRNFRSRRFQSTQTSDTSLSISQRLRKLSREYGWSAVGVYFALSALDFPFCFLAVKTLGTEKIGRWEHVVMTKIKDLVQWPLGSAGKEEVENIADKVKDGMEAGGIAIPVEGRSVGVTATADPGAVGEGYTEVFDHGYHEAEKANRGEGASKSSKLLLRPLD